MNPVRRNPARRRRRAAAAIGSVAALAALAGSRQRCFTRRQRGQALLLGLTLLVLVSLLLFFQFSAGQASAAKLRIVNATDAAAYSTALWRARAMNYYAYSNRAIVANEVAIGQAATMVSFARFLERFSDNVEDVARYFPVVGQIAEAVEQVAHWVSVLTRHTADVEVTARSYYIEALAASQELMFAATHPVVLSRIAAEVARENDRRFFAFVLPRALDPGSNDITRRYEGDDRERLKSIVLRSLDGYSQNRDADLAEIPCLARLARRGATEMIRDHDPDTLERWQAYDTLSAHTRRLFGCSLRERLPLGWGAAEIAAEPKHELDALGDELSLVAGDTGPAPLAPAGASASKRANPRAYAEASDEIWVASRYRGIATVRELDYDSAALQRNDRFPLLQVGVVGWIQSADAIGTAQASGHGTGRVLPRDRFSDRPGAPIGAVAAAEVYFRRPPQDPDRIEYASLYAPYWQVRLAPVPAAWRAAAAGYFQ
ncbi:MAG: hypothetical protein AB7G13_11975 [Lautropia sp.]